MVYLSSIGIQLEWHSQLDCMLGYHSWYQVCQPMTYDSNGTPTWIVCCCWLQCSIWLSTDGLQFEWHSQSNCILGYLVCQSANDLWFEWHSQSNCMLETTVWWIQQIKRWCPVAVTLTKSWTFQFAEKWVGFRQCQANMEIVQPKFGDLADIELSPTNS